MKILPATKNDHPELVELWQASVSASHDFLTKADIEFLKPLILNEYLDAVTLRCIKDDSNTILGFIGVADSNIEMLFVLPNKRGQGIGKALSHYAIETLAASKVDVNEQNPKALGFYQKLGFKVIGRSPLDGQGKPFPLLHLAL